MTPTYYKEVLYFYTTLCMSRNVDDPLRWSGHLFPQEGMARLAQQVLYQHDRSCIICIIIERFFYGCPIIFVVIYLQSSKYREHQLGVSQWACHFQIVANADRHAFAKIFVFGKTIGQPAQL